MSSPPAGFGPLFRSSPVIDGILATLADVALGYTIAFSTRPPTGLITANLTLDFAATAKIGELGEH